MGILVKAVGAVTLAAGAVTASGAELRIVDAWVQAAPPNAKVMAAYMVIENTGGNPQTITRAASPAFARVEIHRTMMHGDMAHMERIGTLPVPARAKVALEPGGLHLMLVNAKQVLRAGDRVPFTMSLSSGAELSFDATVHAVRPGRQDGARGAADHSAHGSHGR